MNYLEQCVESVRSIDANALGAMPVGECVGVGGSFLTYSVGQLSVATEATHVGLKIPLIRPGQVETRVLRDISLITLLTNEVPDLLAAVPSFLALLAIENSGSVGVLTEDASAGGSYDVNHHTQLPERIERELFQAFAEGEDVDKVFNLRALRTNMGFDVNGALRLLDFTPPPFDYSYMDWPASIEAYRRTSDKTSELTVTLDGDSALARSLTARYH